MGEFLHYEQDNNGIFIPETTRAEKSLLYCLGRAGDIGETHVLDTSKQDFIYRMYRKEKVGSTAAVSFLEIGTQKGNPAQPLEMRAGIYRQGQPVYELKAPMEVSPHFQTPTLHIEEAGDILDLDIEMLLQPEEGTQGDTDRKPLLIPCNSWEVVRDRDIKVERHEDDKVTVQLITDINPIKSGTITPAILNVHFPIPLEEDDPGINFLRFLGHNEPDAIPVTTNGHNQLGKYFAKLRNFLVNDWGYSVHITELPNTQ